MNFAFPRFVHAPNLVFRNITACPNDSCLLFFTKKRRFSAITLSSSPKSSEEQLLVVGGGAAGMFGAIRAKTLAPNLKVLVIEKGKPLSKVKISGGGRCNVTNGHFVDNVTLGEKYPRGHKELRGSFFNVHSPMDTMAWFSNHGVELKTEDDGRVFPVSNTSSSIIECLMSEAKKRGVLLQTGKVVTSASSTASGKFTVKLEKRSVDYVEYVDTDYLLIASGSSQQITLSKVKAKLKLETSEKTIPQLTQVGPMLVTHWGLSGPVILKLSAWGARHLSSSDYKGSLHVDFIPDLCTEAVKSVLNRHKNHFPKQKLLSCPSELGLAKRFWKYMLDREGLRGDVLWASISSISLSSLAFLLKNCSFNVIGKGQFKDEFVTAGGVPLSEINLKTMQSMIQPNLFFAGEVLNIDGITGGFNFQRVGEFHVVESCSI